VGVGRPRRREARDREFRRFQVPPLLRESIAREPERAGLGPNLIVGLEQAKPSAFGVGDPQESRIRAECQRDAIAGRHCRSIHRLGGFPRLAVFLDDPEVGVLGDYAFVLGGDVSRRNREAIRAGPDLVPLTYG
jgi:hypothetical protein